VSDSNAMAIAAEKLKLVETSCLHGVASKATAGQMQEGAQQATPAVARRSDKDDSW